MERESGFVHENAVRSIRWISGSGVGRIGGATQGFHDDINSPRVQSQIGNLVAEVLLSNVVVQPTGGHAAVCCKHAEWKFETEWTICELGS